MKKILVLTIIYSILAIQVGAQVKINEFTIETDQSAEIINVGSSSADISNWIIDDNGGTTFYTIPSDSILQPNSCLVFTGAFNLNKSSSDTIKLLNGTTLIDSFTYSASPGVNISFFRNPDGTDNWVTGSATLGSFNSTGLSCVITPSPTPTMTPGPSVQPSSTPIPQSISNIYISEFMVDPPTGEKEWVEIYNDNDFEIELKNWFVDDIESAGGQPQSFNLTIPAKSYRAVTPTTSLFNNSDDSVRLLDSTKSEKDTFEYSSSEKGLTWGRVDFLGRELCLQEPSKEETNNPCLTEDIVAIAEESTSQTAEQKINPPPNTNSPVTLGQTINKPGPRSIQPQVLGDFDEAPAKPNNLHKFLSSLSLIYSTLTTGSLFFRIKLSA